MDIDGGNTSHQPRQPQPRFAHQAVYDPARKLIFLFGGNDGDMGSERLGDFWTLSIARCVFHFSSGKIAYFIMEATQS